MTLETRRYLRATIQSIAIILGNTVGIWMSYFFIQFYFKGINPDISFPGFEIFLVDGTLLIVTFSFLTTVLVSMTNRLKFNFYNVSSIILLVISAIIYSRFIGLGSKIIEGDLMKVWYMWMPFVIASILLFFSLKNQKSVFRKHSWLKGAKNDDFDYSSLSFICYSRKQNEKTKR